MEWNFMEGGETIGPQDADIKEFSKHIFESIVREAVQNSLDNPSGNDPVVVSFNFKEIDKKKIPGYDSLIERYKAAKKFWGSDENYRSIFDSIDNRLMDFERSIPCLFISDKNTTGMDITPKENQNIRFTNYYAFTRGNNTVKSNNQAGGSEGKGKAAFYAASALRTVFVHTTSKYGSIYEGLTRLATHEHREKEYSANGHLFQDLNNPQYENSNNSHLIFRRNTQNGTGTLITIVALKSYKNAKEKMIKSAINNFWFAIYEGELIINIDETEINKSNIESLIIKYLPERHESVYTKSNPTKFGRARCYFETWAEKLPETEIYTSNLPVLGACTLKIAMNHEFPGKIAFFRKQKMLIHRSPSKVFVSKGYCGVFICTDDSGNEILRRMEGKTHTEWDPNLCMVEEDTIKGKNAIKSINEFITNSWSKYRAKHFPESINLKGLAGLSVGTGKKTIVVSPPPVVDPPPPVDPPVDPPPPVPPPVNKIGIAKDSFRSFKKDGDWQYRLKLRSTDNKYIKIEMIPASDSDRVSKQELVEIISATNGWNFHQNSLEGFINEGETTIDFKINNTERVGINFKFKTNEI